LGIKLFRTGLWLDSGTVMTQQSAGRFDETALIVKMRSATPGAP